MSLKKQFLKSKPLCKVSFKVNQKDAKGAKSIQLLGDFNNWDADTAPMKSLKNGSFSQTVNLTSGKDYQFRYLLDGNIWSNEKEADASISNSFNSVNDIVST
ncbi:MAG: isoamylase early set domain-containing protein [Flavobacteriaceae bacterium]|nr:isoamylase early set domain-containing protein [Flavobacteriaceae bacterium]